MPDSSEDFGMLFNESLWFRIQLDRYVADASTVLNAGSSTRHFREVVQPFIHANLFAPLQARGVRVVHVDIKEGAGIDWAGDLTDPAFVAKLRTLRPQAVICSNLLEHLSNRQAFCRALMTLAESGTLFFVSCPYAYPFHPDPIDTLYRPDVDQLWREFGSTELLVGEVVPCGTWSELVRAENRRLPLHGWPRRIKRCLRLMMPFYRTAQWRDEFSGRSRFPSDKTISASCIALRQM